MVCPRVVTGRTSVLVIFMASAPPMSTVGPRVSRALRPPRTTFMGRASGPVSIIAAAPGPSSAAIPIVVVAGETARRVALLGLHLVRGLSVSLSKLDLDLTPTNPFTVQVVKSVFCIPHIFKCATLLRPFIFLISRVGTEKSAHMHNNYKKGCNTVCQLQSMKHS